MKCPRCNEDVMCLPCLPKPIVLRPTGFTIYDVVNDMDVPDYDDCPDPQCPGFAGITFTRLPPQSGL